MKILTREEEEAHYNETLKGGFVGGAAGLALGTLGLVAAVRRYPAFRHMTVPLRAFVITSTGTFGAIVTADHFSRAFEASRHGTPDYQDPAERARKQQLESQTFSERIKSFGREHRYQIVGGSWIASMIAALAITGRNPYLSTQQKIVQARVYAQGLTVAVLIATAVFEIGDQRAGEGRWETRKVIDPNDPEHKRVIEQKVEVGGQAGRGRDKQEGQDQWKDMVEAEEQKMRLRRDSAHEWEEEHGHPHHKKTKKKDHKSEHKSNEDENGSSEEDNKKKEKKQ